MKKSKRNIDFIKTIDRIISGGIGKQILSFFGFTVLIIIIFIVATLFIPETAEIFGIDGKLCRIKGLLYHFLDPGSLPNEMNSTPGVQIITALFSLLGMFLLGGLLITTMTNIVERRVSDIEEGKVTYKSMSDHYVIIGYGDVTISIIRTIYNITGRRDTCPEEDAPTQKYHPTIILTKQNIKMVRSAIFSQLPKKFEKHIYFYSGDIESYEHIKSLNIDKVKEIYILGEKNEYGRDSKNLECVKTIAKLRGNNDNTLTVNVQFDKLTSYSIIQKISLSDEFLTFNGKRTIYCRPFNFYENWARTLWGYKGDLKHNYEKLDFETIEGDKTVHLVIVGFRRMGRALFMEALRQCHYPNFEETPTPKNKTRITILDRELDAMLPEFLAQYPYLDQIRDIDIKYSNAKIEDKEIREQLIKDTKDPNTLLTIAICLEDPDIALSTGLCMPEEVFYTIENNEVKETNTRILIRQALIQEGIGRLLETNNKKYKNVHIFGMSDKGLCKELMNDDLAMYVNAYYDILYYNPKTPSNKNEIIKDYLKYTDGQINSNQELKGNSFIDWVILSEHHEFMHSIAKRLWLLLSEDSRFANRYQVDMYDTYIKYQHSDKLMQMEHLRWNADRSIIGYKDTSEHNLKDNEYKLHKDIIPYCQLSPSEQQKDIDVINNMKKLLNQQVM